jgi:RNA polymerase sigma-70 factor, ECF subfamily
MSSPDDGELMVRYAAGDLRAFTLLYARYRLPLYRYLARQTRNAESATDLFQEVWSRVIAHRSQYEARAPFRTFLFRVAHNCFIDHQRRAALRPSVQESCDQSQERVHERVAAPESDGPEARSEHSELLHRYRAALDALPSEQRDAFLLYQQSGLPLSEVAAITGVGVETAKSRVRYALAKLRLALASELQEAPRARSTRVPLRERRRLRARRLLLQGSD